MEQSVLRERSTIGMAISTLFGNERRILMNSEVKEITCSYHHPRCTPELQMCGYDDCGWELKDYMRNLEQLRRARINKLITISAARLWDIRLLEQSKGDD